MNVFLVRGLWAHGPPGGAQLRTIWPPAASGITGLGEDIRHESGAVPASAGGPTGSARMTREAVPPMEAAARPDENLWSASTPESGRVNHPTARAEGRRLPDRAAIGRLTAARQSMARVARWLARCSWRHAGPRGGRSRIAGSGSRPASDGWHCPARHGRTSDWCSGGLPWPRPHPPTPPCGARRTTRAGADAAVCAPSDVCGCRSGPRRPGLCRAPRTGPGAWTARGRSPGGNVPGGRTPWAGADWPTVGLSPEEHGASGTNGPRLPAKGAGRGMGPGQLRRGTQRQAQHRPPLLWGALAAPGLAAQADPRGPRRGRTNEQGD